MSDVRVLRVIARWLSILMLMGVLCPRLPAWAAPAPAENVSRAGVIVLDSTSDHITLSLGSKDGVTPGTQFRILRGTEELARVKVTEADFATAQAVVISGLPSGQLRANDRAEMVGSPIVRRQGGIKFPWGVLVGAGIVALVVMGISRGNGSATPSGSGGGASPTTGGSANVAIN